MKELEEYRRLLLVQFMFAETEEEEDLIMEEMDELELITDILNLNK